MNLEADKEYSAEYAELLCDFMFKRLFGSEENKDVLIGFLNMIMEENEIEDVEFIPTEYIGLTEEDKMSIFDISCKCKNGKTLIIEMQKGYQKHFRKRAIFYTSYPINEQGRHAREAFIREHQSKGDGCKFKWDYDLKPVTVVAILNFKFNHDETWPDERYHSSYRLREDCTGEIMTDTLRFVFLELYRFKKQLWELETTFDKWMYLLRHMHTMTTIPEIFQTPEFKRLFILAEIGKFTPEEYKQYIKSLGNMSDYYNVIDTAAEEAEKRGRAEGIEIGMSKGRAEGLAEGREIGRSEGIEAGSRKANMETAKNLKQLGVSVDIIAQSTGLSYKVIETL